ncbi:MAG: PQQ-dependent sugar dehydrogenase [Sediminicola sp.]
MPNPKLLSYTGIFMRGLPRMVGAILLLFSAGTHAQVTYQDAFPNITFNYAAEIQNANDGSNRLFVVEQSGRIRVFPNQASVTNAQVNTFLDLSGTVSFSTGQEIGLLGLAFHPNFSQNRYFYVYHTRRSSLPGINVEMVLSRYTVRANNPNQADPNSRLEIFTFDKNQNNSNHNGGKIAFGPDGYLYISIGDGGGGGDPNKNAQNLNNPFGSILRIDVDVNGNNPVENNPDLPNGNYEIPSDNPRVGQSGLDELYAWGIRNTWKFSFDNTNNRMWGADVGQDGREEINLIQRGGNYGWNRFEGANSYNTTTTLATTPDIKPIFSYSHNNGDVSITGGYVYRGASTNPSLQGRYIFGDYVTGRVWSLNYNSSNGSATSELLFRTNGQFVSSFGLDEAGELYFSDYGTSKKLYRIVGGSSGPVTNPVNGIGTWANLGNGTNGVVEAIAAGSDGRMYVGGQFNNAGGNSVRNLATYHPNDGWASFGSGTNGKVNAIAVAPGGNVYVGGEFTEINGVSVSNIAVWNGSNWAAMGSGTDGPVAKIGIDGNGTVFAGGAFMNAGGTRSNNIARWNGTTWSALTDAATSTAGTNNEIRAIAFDENNVLYVGGNFDTAGGNSAARIARWNGSNWSGLGSGTSGFVQAIAITPNAVYAGGNFAQAGGQTVNRVARWNRNSQTWQALGSGLSGNVNSMLHDGSFLYVGGNFQTASDILDLNLVMKSAARWNDSEGWQAMGTGTSVGVNNQLNTLAFSNDGARLYAGGNFSIVGLLSTLNIAVWGLNLECTDASVIPEYRLNGQWSSGDTTLEVDEGVEVVLSILPNGVNFTIETPDGTFHNGDLNLGEVTPENAGEYILETSEGCTRTLTLTVAPTEVADDDGDGVPNTEDDCPNTPDGAIVDANGCEPSSTDDDGDGVPNAQDDCPNTPEGITVDENGCEIITDTDDDGDGIPNDLDDCPNTPEGATVDDNGCVIPNTDDDGDGVPNAQDDCPNTPEGANVDANGCVISSFPSNNFTILASNASCANTNTGTISVTSLIDTEYSASLTGELLNNEYTFTNELEISELPIGRYDLCITAVGDPSYQNCSTINIGAPEQLSVLMEMQGSTNSVTLKMSGAKKYTITLNGLSMETDQSEVTLALEKEQNTIRVATDLACQGSFEDTLIRSLPYLLEENPIEDTISVFLGEGQEDTVTASIYTSTGSLISTDSYDIIAGKLTMDATTLPAGVYYLKLENSHLDLGFKVLKK